MLELLSGSTTIYNAHAPGSPISAIAIATAQDAFYDDSLGLCSYHATVGGYCITQLDGATHLRSYQPRSNAFALDLQRPGGYLMHDSSFERSLYLFDKATGTSGTLVTTGATNHVINLHVRTHDRYLSAIGSSVQSRPLDLSTAFATETTLTGAGSGRASWSRTRSDNVLALVWPDGTVGYYDVEARAQVTGVAYLGTNVGAWYSPKHDVFVAIPTSSTLKVFASAVRPSSLSNPAAVSAITQGRVSQVKVRLLGADSDPCADELVDWSITAGVGTLTLAQSTTDADGWAYNNYVAPVASGSPDNVTIQAQVNF